ncbi:GRB2-related adaptor protein 2-like [Pseudochaenichthys georgianus]|uniref:GRB2-related adaptor protein 2-like n=1 Tax=Pseudochaenichthys georgianus TaxID=52239 RepID=UPI00146DD99B|nr:GRB2-related adaptor protein 2-like [Pseudochaenichthys georgianus]
MSSKTRPDKREGYRAPPPQKEGFSLRGSTPSKWRNSSSEAQTETNPDGVSGGFTCWYQEDCSRAEAEEQLMKKPVGAFVIRGSRKTVHGDFSISVRLEAAVQHFKVMRDSRGQYYLWSERFPSLNQLVEYYQHTSISKQTKVFLLGPQQQRGSEDVLPSQRPLPPPPSSCPPASAPVAPRQVRALYTFEAEESDELGFNTGDVISVLESSDPTWWRGALRGKSGLFPSNHTTPL